MVKIESGPKPKGMKSSALVPSRCGSTQKMAANVKVVVRVRPMNDRELERHSRTVVDVVDDKMLVFDPKEEDQPFFYQGVQQPSKSYLRRGNKELKFVFDHVCGQQASNQEVFEATTKDILTSLMEGYNCSVFVYGATGAGKTFTMIGNKEYPGITYLTMEHLFDMINGFENEREFDIGVSYIEVYNENVFDLIKPSKTPLQLREDNKYGVMVAGLTLNNIKTARELLNMLENGNKNRTQHPTDANAESSRSHAVFQVYIKMSYKTSNQVRIVKLSMIDLAGSERASATGCVGDRFKEGANINRSLLSLANCINKLADGSSYIPYRDSKLTRLLKDSLGGNCKTVMIANVSPSSASYEDTYNTLKYAARANKIQLSIKKNIVDGDMRLSSYVKINEELKKKVKELEAKILQKDTDNKQSVSSKIVEELKKKVKDLETKLTASTIKTEKESSKTEELKKKIQELQAKLSLSSLRDTAREKEWRDRILEEEATHAALERELLSLMARQRVLALRHRLRTRAFSHVAELAHRSSTEAMEQMVTEDIPRQTRAAESYNKQALHMDAKVMSAWTKWDISTKKLNHLFNLALSECPDMTDFIEKIRAQSKMRHLEARDELRYKLLMIENEEINAFTEYMSDMPTMLKKLYLTLKGYDRATPALTAEYLEIMKKAKSAKGISWSDDGEVSSDPQFKFICNLTLDKPVTHEFAPSKRGDVNATIDVITDSDDFTSDIENREPIRSAKKRKGTPIKLMNNETIIINDSYENLDMTKTLNSAKKVKKEFDASFDVENCGLIQPKDLNSTFDMQGNMEALKKSFKDNNTNNTNAMTKSLNIPVKRELADRTNTMTRSVNFNMGNGAKIARPVQCGQGWLLAREERTRQDSNSKVSRFESGPRAGKGAGASVLQTGACAEEVMLRSATEFDETLRREAVA
ncbi:kinesin motor domain-containing protein [Phthorimaea operculella]|nr:kinesin motor domain-containing protein [Phthorimaea operculella]